MFVLWVFSMPTSKLIIPLISNFRDGLVWIDFIKGSPDSNNKFGVNLYKIKKFAKKGDLSMMIDSFYRFLDQLKCDDSQSDVLSVVYFGGIIPNLEFKFWDKDI
jgi:hypothetical protein